jgi:hypothetical protein
MIKGVLATLSIGLVFFTAPAAVQAAAPANDSFAAAAPLAAGQEISGVNLDATAEPGEPNPANGSKSEICAAIGDGPDCATSVWYLFQPAVSGEYTIETCDGGTDVDSVLGVYTGAAIGSAVAVLSNDDACAGGYDSNGSRVVFSATAGTVYHVDLSGFAGDQGSFYLRAYAGPAQARPLPDTDITREDSFLLASAVEGISAGVLSGPRHSASFALISSQPGASFQCSLDGSAFAACASPVSYEGLEPGSSHVFEARALSGGSLDPTPVIERFTLDLAPPETTLTSGPQGNSASQEAKWTAVTSERNLRSVGFLCGVDGQRTGTCTSSRTFSSLCKGAHTYHSAAWDRAGNVDPTPALAQINVTTGPACTTPTIGAPVVGMIAPTSVQIEVPFEDKGAGGTLHLEYGPTSAYGMTVDDLRLSPSVGGSAAFTLRALAPGTLYHYRLTITTPFGTAGTPDQTVTSAVLTGSLPSIFQSDAPVVGPYTAAIPVTIDSHGVVTSYAMRIATAGPITLASPSISASTQIKGDILGSQFGRIEVVDLEPATTYHYRIFAGHDGSDFNQKLGPEGSFTTSPLSAVLPPPPPLPPAERHFKLGKKSISIGKLKEDSKKLMVKVRGLPTGTAVKLALNAGKGQLKAQKKARTGGIVKFTLRLSSKIRAALQSETLKKVTIRIVATPPGDSASSVTLRPRLRH